MSFINAKTQPNSVDEKSACADIVLCAIKNKIKSKKDLMKLQKDACKKYKTDFVTNPMLLNTYRKLIKEKRIKKNDKLFQILRKRKIRTSSGIAAVAVLTKPYPCPGKCIYCPSQKNVPKSYIDNEPAVMRAILADYDPVRQINIRLRGLELAGNPADKIELIVMGGTFSYLPKKYQLQFIIGCFWACNQYSNKQQVTSNKRKIQTIKDLELENKTIKELLKLLKKEHKKNERGKYRIIGLTLETRPDYINQDELKWFRELGCTRVEIGVQSIYDRVLNKNNRGHGVDATIKATKLLKNAGFKICYHLMPNLLGSNLKKDLEMFKTLFSDQRFQPDMIKIYPCVVTKYAQLAKIYECGMYKPYTDKELMKLLISIKKKLPEYVRVQRLIRDIPAQNIIAGSKMSNMRQIIQDSNKRLVTSDKENKPLCQCIRCREIRGDKKLPVKLKRVDYDASDGKEIFLQYVDKNNKIYALLRLRILSFFFNPRKSAFVRDCRAIIREVHTYGPMVLVGEKIKKDPQHSGLGKKLIKEAEKITMKEFNLKKITVISGIGVRNYYRKLGYKLKTTYLVKNLL